MYHLVRIDTQVSGWALDRKFGEIDAGQIDPAALHTLSLEVVVGSVKVTNLHALHRTRIAAVDSHHAPVRIGPRAEEKLHCIEIHYHVIAAVM